MKTILKNIGVLLLLVVLSIQTEAAILKIRDGEGRRIVVTINGKRFQKVGKVLTINNVPPGNANIKVYRYQPYGNGMANADLIYRGSLFVRYNYIYRCTVDDYEGMDVQEFCCINNNGVFNYNNNMNNNFGFYDDHDHDWEDEFWCGNHPNNQNNPNGNWNNNQNNWNNNNNFNVMNVNTFAAFKNTLRNNNFDSGRLTIMKSQLNNSRITAAQLRELVEIFSFESSKLDAAKYGASRVVDGSNLFLIYDVFDYESSRTAFANYVTQQNLGSNMNGWNGGNGNGNGWNNGGGNGGNGNGWNNGNNGNGNGNGWNNGNNGNGNGGNGWNNGNGGNGGNGWNNGNGGNGANGQIMGPQMFNAFKQTLSNSSIESSRLNLLRSQLGNSRISASQLSELVGLFSFESNKLEAAKFGARKVVDRQNLFIVNNEFSFESSKTEFARFVSSLN